MSNCYKEYLTAQITKDFAAAERAWSNIPEYARKIFYKLALDLENYHGKHVEAPIGSTWKAHDSLIKRVEQITKEYLDDFANMSLSNADSLDFKC